MLSARDACAEGTHSLELRDAEPRRVRSLFVSDVHLGIRFSQAAAFSRLLDVYEPESLYVLGDFIDGWRLRRRWCWNAASSRILLQLLQLAKRGIRVRYATGNHDGFLRGFLGEFAGIEIADEFVHDGGDGRQYLVLHGDRFDDVEKSAPWLSKAASIGYSLLLWTNYLLSCVYEQLGWGRCPLSGWVKMRIKSLVAYLSRFEQRLVAHARSRRCQGVICGHTHTPVNTQHGDIAYYNTGDWIEHCSAVIELDDGELRIVRFASDGPSAMFPQGGSDGSADSLRIPLPYTAL